MKYVLNDTKFIALYGEITEISVDAIAVPAYPCLRMDAGITGKIRATAGPQVEVEAMQQAPATLGSAVITEGGALPVKNIFHCVMLDDKKNADPDALRCSVRDVLEKATAKGLKKIAFPAIGASFPGLMPKTSTKIIVAEAKRAVDEGMSFSEIVFVVCDPAPYTYFKRALKECFQ